MKYKDVDKSLKNIKKTVDEIRNVLKQEKTPKQNTEFYTITEVSEMLKTSQQQIWLLFERYKIETIDISSGEKVKRPTYRVARKEIVKLKKAIGLETLKTFNPLRKRLPDNE